MRREDITRRALMLIAVLALIPVLDSPAASDRQDLDTGNRFQPHPRQPRTVDGDLCATAVELGRNQSFTVDLCVAWNDYDPGTGCSPCALPGPEIVARLDTQAGERLRLTTSLLSGGADVRLYLATDCDDPAATCVAAASGPDEEFAYTVTHGGELFLFVDTTGDCGTVEVSRAAPASALATTFSSLKAVYR